MMYEAILGYIVRLSGNKGLGFNSVVPCLPRKHKALSLIRGTEKTKKKKYLGGLLCNITCFVCVCMYRGLILGPSYQATSGAPSETGLLNCPSWAQTCNPPDSASQRWAYDYGRKSAGCGVTRRVGGGVRTNKGLWRESDPGRGSQIEAGWRSRCGGGGALEPGGAVASPSPACARLQHTGPTPSRCRGGLAHRGAFRVPLFVPSPLALS